MGVDLVSANHLGLDQPIKVRLIELESLLEVNDLPEEYLSVHMASYIIKIWLREHVMPH
jgi:hypothetical protein